MKKQIGNWNSFEFSKYEIKNQSILSSVGLEEEEEKSMEKSIWSENIKALYKCLPAVTTGVTPCLCYAQVKFSKERNCCSSDKS